MAQVAVAPADEVKSSAQAHEVMASVKREAVVAGKRGSSKRSSGKRSSGKKGSSKPRSIGRWYIGETLGKGGYSWVKKGYDKRTSKCVALKFMAKADSTWEDEQTKQVITEIESLKKIRHPNVMKLYAYNLNAKYPTKTRSKIESILLVLEYAPGGELFDILYYTSALSTLVGRTYFRQFMAGLEACHAVGVAHRDLKPQNLLLDAKFNLKITDFGLSKVFQSDADTIMKTTYVGTRGYQAPELLLDRRYDLGCDIFSAGVVLFILLTGYPPFEQAHKADRWFRPLAKRDYKKFWDLHAECLISDDEDAKNLLQRMLCYDPKKRITLPEIKVHKWFHGEFLQGKDLIKKLMKRHRDMERKRRKDARKMKDLATSIKVPDKARRAMELGPVPEFNDGGVETQFVHCTHTTIPPAEVFLMIEYVVGLAHGKAELDTAAYTMQCSVKLGGKSTGASSVRFAVQIFQSTVFVKPEAASDTDEDEKDFGSVIYIVRIRRISGDFLEFSRVRKQLIFDQCHAVLTGLPKWARAIQKAREVELSKADEDDYDAVLAGGDPFAADE